MSFEDGVSFTDTLWEIGEDSVEGFGLNIGLDQEGRHAVIFSTHFGCGARVTVEQLRALSAAASLAAARLSA